MGWKFTRSTRSEHLKGRFRALSDLGISSKLGQDEFSRKGNLRLPNWSIARVQLYVGQSEFGKSMEWLMVTDGRGTFLPCSRDPRLARPKEDAEPRRTCVPTALQIFYVGLTDFYLDDSHNSRNLGFERNAYCPTLHGCFNT